MSPSAAPSPIRLNDLIRPIVASLSDLFLSWRYREPIFTMPGMLVLRNDGFKTSTNPIVTTTGLGSFVMAPFGCHAFNIAAIMAAIVTGREAHEDPSKRWIAGIAAGCFYMLVRVFGVTLTAVFMVFPATFITALAGLALPGTIGGSFAGAMADPASREATLTIFLAAAAHINMLGIGGAFWGLMIGLLAYVVLKGKLRRKSTIKAEITESAAE